MDLFLKISVFQSNFAGLELCRNVIGRKVLSCYVLCVRNKSHAEFPSHKKFPESIKWYISRAVNPLSLQILRIGRWRHNAQHMTSFLQKHAKNMLLESVTFDLIG